jgi:hypothetical protein
MAPIRSPRAQGIGLLLEPSRRLHDLLPSGLICFEI